MKPTQMLPLVKLFRRVALCFVLVILSAGAHAWHDQQATPILEYGRGLPQSVQWSPQGDTVLVTTSAGVLWRYDARLLETIDHFPGIFTVRYSPSGSWLFTQDAEATWAIRSADDPADVVADGFSTVWQHPESAWLVTVDAHGSEIRPDSNPAQVALGGLESVYFSPNAAHLLTFAPSTGFVLRTADLSPLVEHPDFPDMASGVHWSLDGEQIALFSGTDRVDMVAVPAGEVISFTLPDQARYNRVQWSPDSTRLLDSDDRGNIRIWDAVTGQLLLELPTGEPYLTPEERALDPFYPPDFWYVKWSADGSHTFRCDSDGGDVYERCRFYDSATGTEVGQADGDSVGRLQTDPEGRYFIASAGVFDAATGQLIAPFDTDIDGGGRQFSPDGRRVALGSMWQPDIHIYDLDALKLEHTFDIPPGRYDYYAMSWSPDGMQLATWGRYGLNSAPGSGLISFWDMNTGRETGHINQHILFGREMVFNTDSSRLAAADNLGNIALFDTSTGDLSLVLSGLEERAAMLAWQPGGTLLAATTGRVSGYGNPTHSPRGGTQVHVWDTRTGDLITTLDHTNTVLALLWHPSGKLLVTDDFTGVSLWDAETWMHQQVTEMSGGMGTGVRYRWTKDGDILMRGHSNCTHGGGDSLNFLDVTTLQHFGPLDCSGDRPYEWSETLGGIPMISVPCESTSDDGGRRCWIHVSILLLKPQNEKPLGRFHTYQFDQFDQDPQTFTSPDGTEIVVMTDSALQFWRLEANSAALLWSGEPADNVVWSHDGEALALVTDDSIRIVGVESGAERVIIADVQPDVSAIEWSQDDAFLLVRSESSATVFNTASGVQIPLPDGMEHAYWESRFLRFRHRTNEEFVWWDVRSARVALAGDYLPTVVSDDGRFGAEARSGVLRMWKLTR